MSESTTAATGARTVVLPGPLRTESGAELPGVRVAYETWGRMAPDGSNAILVLHALTGDSHAAGPAGPGFPSPGWWDALIGPGRALDTDRFFVVAPNVLGGCRGTTGPSSPGPDGRPWGSRFPAITIRDQVAAEAALADELGIPRWYAVVGGSMGGMRALEWAVTYPERVASLFVVACGAEASAEQIAWCSTQVHAIRADAHWHGGDYHDVPGSPGPVAGLGVARRIAQVTYRSEPELAARFGRRLQPDDGPAPRFAIQSYLDHHAEKLVRRFDAGSYVVLTEAMNSHDVGRGRGGVEAALARVTARTMVAGVSSDRLYPLSQQRVIAEGITGAGEVHVVESPHGHDGFLVESPRLAELVAGFVGEPVAGLEALTRPGARGARAG